jgi:hypothetical protein
VLAEAAQKLRGCEGHLALLVAVRVVFPAECNAAASEREQAMIADGDPMSISAKIAQDLRSSSKCGLGVYNPLLRKERIRKSGEASSVPEFRHAAGADQFSVPECLPQAVNKLGAKDAT